MFIKDLCLACRHRENCPIGDRLDLFDELATELVKENAEPWWHNWEIRVVITTCERYKGRYAAPDAHAYEERFETDC